VNEFTHIDLFSGIGGFSLAAQWAGFRTVVFCEIDEFCQEVLKRCWPEVQIIQNIRNFDGSRWTGATLLTGGFPCQPFSSAGRKRGKADDRNLWPEMLQVISRARPTWVIAENVTGIAYMVLADCENDLEAEGYKAQSFDIPACACGLSTMERHIWIIATHRGKFVEGNVKKRIQGIRKIQPCIGRKDHNETKGFPRIPDLPESRLLGSRKGIPHWVDRHKALGNAIPPQVAYEIIKGIAMIEKGKFEQAVSLRPSTGD
jgi:DNA (cytosine-5)-methyltransferase 1